MDHRPRVPEGAGDHVERSDPPFVGTHQIAVGLIEGGPAQTDPPHRTQHQKPTGAGGGDQATVSSRCPPGQDARDPHPDEQETGQSGRRQGQSHPQPHPPGSTGPQVVAHQQGEESGDGFEVEIEGDGFVHPGVGHEDDGGADDEQRPGPGGKPVTGALDDFLDPREGDGLGGHRGQVLHPEQSDGTGVDVKEKGQRPHGELAVVLPEGNAQDPDVRDEIPVGDGPPGLRVLGEIIGQGEAAVLLGAEGQQGQELEAQKRPSDDGDPAGQSRGGLGTGEAPSGRAGPSWSPGNPRSRPGLSASRTPDPRPRSIAICIGGRRGWL